MYLELGPEFLFGGSGCEDIKWIKLFQDMVQMVRYSSTTEDLPSASVRSCTIHLSGRPSKICCYIVFPSSHFLPAVCLYP